MRRSGADDAGQNAILDLSHKFVYLCAKKDLSKLVGL